MDKGEVLDPAQSRFELELSSPGFRAGAQSDKWRLVEKNFPVYLIEINGTRPDGSRAWFCIRFEVRGYPEQKVWAQQWSLGRNATATQEEWPRGNERVETAFKGWSENNVPHLYCPWERAASNHNGFHSAHPGKAWNSERKFTFILEDLYGLLNLNAFSSSPR